MSAVESRLAAIIAEQMRTDGWTCEYHEPTSREGECSGCDESLTRTARAAAAVIASADDLAVIELPEPDGDRALEWCDGNVYASAGFDRVRVYVEDARHSIAGARELAAGILAAAKAAEGVSDRG